MDSAISSEVRNPDVEATGLQVFEGIRFCVPKIKTGYDRFRNNSPLVPDSAGQCLYQLARAFHRDIGDRDLVFRSVWIQTGANSVNDRIGKGRTLVN